MAALRIVYLTCLLGLCSHLPLLILLTVLHAPPHLCFRYEDTREDRVNALSTNRAVMDMKRTAEAARMERLSNKRVRLDKTELEVKSFGCSRSGHTVCMYDADTILMTQLMREHSRLGPNTFKLILKCSI